jgi:hypothetical protein
VACPTQPSHRRGGAPDPAGAGRGSVRRAAEPELELEEASFAVQGAGIGHDLDAAEALPVAEEVAPAMQVEKKAQTEPRPVEQTMSERAALIGPRSADGGGKMTSKIKSRTVLSVFENSSNFFVKSKRFDFVMLCAALTG